MAEEKRFNVSKVMELYKSAENWMDIRQQLININYYNNNQWVRWNTNRRAVEKLPADNQLRLTINKIRPRVNALLAKHVKTRVKFDVVPGSNEDADIDAAKAADKYMSYMWDELDMSAKTEDMFLYALIQKRTWLKVWYDATAGDDISPTEEDGKIYEDWVEQGGKPINKGEIRTRACDPLTIFFDPSARSEEDLRWVIERRAIDVDEIEETYDVTDIVPDANLSYLTQYEMNSVDNNPVNKLKNMALVTELWWKKCKKHPDGLKVTVCNDRIIDYDENAGDIPFFLFGYIPTPGSLWHDAIVTDLLDPQRELNVIRSMLANQARKMGNPVWNLPIGSIVNEDDLNNDIGAIIRYDPTVPGKPERVGAPDVPSYYSLMLQQIQLDIDDMSGAREITQGSLPAGLDTAAGLELMVEQENEKLSVSSQAYERCLEKSLKRVLQLMKEHYTEERQAKIIGEGNEIEIIRFNASDLNDDADIRIIPGSSLPELKSAQQSRIMTMWGAGAIVDKNGQPDANKFVRLMGTGEADNLYEDDALDENNAKTENDAFMELPTEIEQLLMAQQQTQMLGAELGQEVELPPLPGVPVVWSSDNHLIHIEKHNMQRKTPAWRNLSEWQRMLFDQHIAKHEEELNAPMVAQQQAMMQQQQEQQMMAMQQQEQASAAKQQEEAVKFEQSVAMKAMDHEANMQKLQVQEEGKIAQTAMKAMV